MNIVKHNVRMRDIRPDSDNESVQVGKPDMGDFVVTAMFQNQGRNSLVKIWKDGSWIELRPFEPAFTIGVEWPGVLDTTLKVIFENENQQQYDAEGNQSALNPAETDITALDAIYHKLNLVEITVSKQNIC